MKLIRTGLVVAAVGALMTLPLAAAHAAPAPQTLKVTSFSGTGSQGWTIDDNGIGGEAYPYEFVAGNNPPIGTGSLQFGTTAASVEAEKMFLKHEETILAPAFVRAGFSYYFGSDSAVKAPSQYYLNLYVDTAAATGTNFYDCRFDYVATQAADGTWGSMAATRDQAATAVAVRNGATCGASIAGLQPTDKIFRVAINAGDTTNSDAGIKGGLDKAVVQSDTSDITYDFEAPPACAQANLPVITGTSRNDARNGTEAAEKIDLLAGNDSSDAKGGADCVLGGDGNDQLKGGAGDDDIRSGAGNDSVDAGPGKDVVDAGAGNDLVNVKDGVAEDVNCGAGNDIAIADGNDNLTGCEIRR